MDAKLKRAVTLGCIGLAALTLGGCGLGAASDNAEMGNAAGDALASLDETSQGGQFAQLGRPLIHERDFLKAGFGHSLAEALLPSARAAGCWQESFTPCANGVRTRTFDGCTIGSSSLNGSVTLTFSDASCSMSSDQDAVTRSANFTLAGPNGGTYTVSAPNGGQTVTRVSGGLTYAVQGLERVATNPAGDKIFDISVESSQPLSISGNSRANRVLNSGTLVITNNLKNYQATLSASAITWNNTCNCPVSGSLNGTFSGTKTGTADLTITGCGTATLVTDKVTESIVFDRCGKL